MIRLFALLPLLTFGLWWLYLHHNNWTIKQGLTGFKIIFVINIVVLGFFTMMYFLTQVD